MVGTFPGHLKKFVIAVVPHTSFVDFFLGVLVRAVWKEAINWIGKKSLLSRLLVGFLGGWAERPSTEARKTIRFPLPSKFSMKGMSFA